MKKEKQLKLFVLLSVLLTCSFLIPTLPVRAMDVLPPLVNLLVEDISLNAVLEPEFSPDVTEYEFVVQSDIYGVGFTPITASVKEGQPERDIKVKIDGVEVESDTRYVVPLSEEMGDYGKILEQKVDIVVFEGDESLTYKIIIRRESAQEFYDAFQIGEFEDEDSGAKIDYALYVPADYDADKEYPLVLAMHGSGQSTQPVDMVLKRYELATTWLKHGYECIVLVPHAMNLNADDGKFTTNWSTTAGTDPFGLGEAGKVAYNLLQNIREKYSVDMNRQYLTGLSMGGWGVYAMIVDHPEEWAGALLSCATTWDHDDEVAAIISEFDIPIWIVHAADDNVRSFGEFAKMVNALNRSGANYRVTVYPNGKIFHPSGHFSWTPMYADTVILDWLFAQNLSD